VALPSQSATLDRIEEIILRKYFWDRTEKFEHIWGVYDPNNL
jgi:hypothetical protein